MRARIFFLPVAALVISQPAHATIYMNLEQAQALIFPGATFSQDFRKLSREQARAIEKASGVHVVDLELRAWRASTGGWLIVDEVLGKHEFIPFAVGIDAAGAIKDVEILEYREAYGEEVRDPKWRAQFTGTSSLSRLRFPDDIRNISGATLSSKHITEGIRRVMATYTVALTHS